MVLGVLYGAGVVEAGSGVVVDSGGDVSCGVVELVAGSGVVELVAGSGVVELVAGAGVVELVAGSGVVELVAGAGVVELVAGAGVVELVAGAGVVELVAGSGVVELVAGSGVVELVAGSGVVELVAGPISALAHPRVVEVPLAVDDGALGGPRALGHGDGGAEVLVGGLVRAADEALGVEDLAHEVEGLEGDGLPAVVDLLREEGAQRAAAVEARLDLLPEVAHELLLRERVAARGARGARCRGGHAGGVVNMGARVQVVCVMLKELGVFKKL